MDLVPARSFSSKWSPASSPLSRDSGAVAAFAPSVGFSDALLHSFGRCVTNHADTRVFFSRFFPLGDACACRGALSISENWGAWRYRNLFFQRYAPACILTCQALVHGAFHVHETPLLVPAVHETGSGPPPHPDRSSSNAQSSTQSTTITSVQCDSQAQLL